VAHRKDRSDGALSSVEARRVANQIERVLHGTFGAESGLRMIVRSIARQLLVAGSSPDVVAMALEREVLEHPGSRAADRRDGPEAKVNSRTLVALTRQCVAEVALETEQGNARP
jgi:hypothetical protein